MAVCFVVTDGFLEDVAETLNGIALYRQRYRQPQQQQRIREINLRGDKMATEVSMAALLERSFHEDEGGYLN